MQLDRSGGRSGSGGVVPQGRVPEATRSALEGKKRKKLFFKKEVLDRKEIKHWIIIRFVIIKAKSYQRIALSKGRGMESLFL